MTPPSPFSDLVRLAANRLAESGVAALAGLYDLTSGRLVRYAVTITGNQHDAEDAVSTALVRVADHPPLLAQAQRPWPYLLRMVRNESLQITRRRRWWQGVGDLSDLLRQGVSAGSNFIISATQRSFVSVSGAAANLLVILLVKTGMKAIQLHKYTK